MHNLVYSLAVGNTCLITELVEFDAKVQRSQKYLFQIDPTSDCLIDTRFSTTVTVEHRIGPTRRSRIRRFAYPDFPANATYYRLQPTNVQLGGKWLLVGNITTAPSQPGIHRDPAPSYRRVWG